MPQITFQVKNMDQLRAAFRQAPTLTAPFLREASMKSAFTVEGKSKTLAPVLTGRLRASIATSLGIVNQGITSIVQTNVHYAIFVHDGTRRMRGRPFMKQGVEQSMSTIERYYREAEGKAVQAIANMAS